jgi:hypothetical protein
MDTLARTDAGRSPLQLATNDPAGALASGGGETWTAQPNSAGVRAWVTRVVPVMHRCSAI